MYKIYVKFTAHTFAQTPLSVKLLSDKHISNVWKKFNSITENIFKTYFFFEIKMQYHRRERPLLKGTHNSTKLFRLSEQPNVETLAQNFMISTIKRSFIIRPMENM